MRLNSLAAAWLAAALAASAVGAQGLQLGHPLPPGSQPKPGPDGQVGTVAPDGIGVVVAPSPGAGTVSDGPWEPASLMTPLTAGARMPAGSVVQTVEGAPFDLNAAVAAKPTVLIFYRGGWCPYCNAHLRDLQKSEPALRAMGYQILAVSADPPNELRQTLTQDHLDYTLLSDASLSVAAKFGLKYKVRDYYLDHLRTDHNTDLVKQNGGYLLTPAAFVLDPHGVIRFAYANNNFTVRVGQDSLLKAARSALQESKPTSGSR